MAETHNSVTKTSGNINNHTVIPEDYGGVVHLSIIVVIGGMQSMNVIMRSGELNGPN